MPLDQPGDVEALAQFLIGKLEALAYPVFSLATAASKRNFALQPGWVRELGLVHESLVGPLLQGLNFSIS